MINDLKRIFIKGGVLSPGELKQIIRLAETLGLKEILFGSRQDIILPFQESDREILKQFPDLTMDIVTERAYQNIVCSYVSSDIYKNTPWLNGVKYLYILEDFKHLPKLKINITDPLQQLVPLFSGHLNFIASSHEDYWYLNLKLPHWEESVYYPVLIFSYDIAKISKEIEEIGSDADDAEELFDLINDRIETNNRTIEKELKVTYEPFPYYEGMNKIGMNRYWLGLYWRNNRYDISFLKDFSEFCLNHRVGKICITPWKSFIVKGIYKEDKLTLEKFLGKKGINVRHSSLELNWHIPVGDSDALNLKEFIVKSFDQNDISTYGMTFGISNQGENKTYFTTAMVEKNRTPDIVKNFQVRPTFNVLYSKNFDPNTQEYIAYAQDVDKIELPGLLMELSQMYFDQLGEVTESKESKKTKKEAPVLSDVYQCSECMTIYDSAFGDEQASIPPNTSFENLPDDYTCSVCEATKENYKKAIA
ncbi:rubredoxin [Flavicella sediminum]|uniref:rubredoxin n=1 Tax=Flavicella sediminum TaxID=2585141 RepID=UPI00111EFB2D|nr:rubredoxin [Flavicella sediminum]